MVAMRLVLAVLFLMLVDHAGAQQEPSTYVGGAACAGCHAAQTAQWQKSHHAHAMEKPTQQRVLGDFDNAEITHFGVTTRFFRKGDAFMIRTDGPGGAMAEYEIAYTLGIAPLQQYLIAMPGGRLQALGIAWDARPKTEGGQRWYHLYPDRKLQAGDRLHWTGRDQTVNFMCADCHTTNLRKNYDLATDSYATTWTDAGVTCEACHGPGSRHIAWAQTQKSPRAPGLSDDQRKGIVNWLAAGGDARWEMEPETGIARRNPPLASQGVLDTCAGCHALRTTVTPPAPAGTPFAQSFTARLLDPGQFHADGQIDGETFEYAAFVQSRMHRAGVTCTDCHDPHAGRTRAVGNAICAACHMPEKFDTATHHHHVPGTAGAQCAACHMPAKTYMGVDVRHDHSFRVPRPDLTATIGAPNACTACHADKPANWAAQAIAAWFPAGQHTRPHYGHALHAARNAAVNAERLLNAVIADPAQPAIARASALTFLPGLATSASLPAWRTAITDPDPLVRLGAARAVPPAPSASMLQAVAPLLADPARSVRVEAARALAGSAATLPPDRRAAFEAAWQELLAAEMTAADRPEAQINLGLLYARRGQPAAAEAAYRTALRLDPGFIQAMVNLADLDRARSNQASALEWLRKAASVEPDNADVRHAIGLALVRERRTSEAMAELRRAVELAPDNARYAYVLAIALNSTGAPREALALLERTRARAPGNRDVLIALATISRDSGDLPGALRYARMLIAANPNDPAAVSLLRSLGGQ